MSDFIGPARSWNNIEWAVDESTNLEVDTVYLKVFGYNEDQKEETLLFDPGSCSFHCAVHPFPHSLPEYHPIGSR